MAAASSSLGTQFHEELTCSICLELFTRPKVLPCQHTFCQSPCLENLAGRERTFECPNCRQKVRLPPQGVAGLPDNRLVTSLCEKLSEKRREPIQCRFHPLEEVKLYCKTKQCQVPVCDLCIEESHNGHHTTTITKAAHEKKSAVQDLINEGRNISESYRGYIKGLEETEKTLTEQKQQTDNSIIQAYDQMGKKLTERKEHLLSESQQDYSENLEGIRNEKDAMSANDNELSAACDQAEQELQEEAVEFLRKETGLTEVVEKYRKKAAPTHVQTQPAVFQPADTPVPVLGHVTAQSHPSTPRGTGNHHGNQSQGESWSHSVTFGREGSGKGQFDSPHGVTVSDEGEIFVADQENQRIQVFTLQGTFVRQFPTVMPGGQKMYPQDVAMGRKENLWVVGHTDTEFAVQYDKQGKVLKYFDLQRSGWNRGIAVNSSSNHLFITQTTGDVLYEGNCPWKIKEDNRHGEVLEYSQDGTLLRTIGSKWMKVFILKKHMMLNPWSITVCKGGNIIVTDHANHCVFVYNEDGELQFGSKGSGDGQLDHPSGICTDKEGNIIVADQGNNRIEMFDKTGRFLKHIATDIFSPLDVAMTMQGQLVVTDDKKHTVSIFYT